MREGFTVWLTGLPGSGKSTLAKLVAAEIVRRGRHAEVLDGGALRHELWPELGFSKDDRDSNIKRISYICRLLTRSGIPNIVAAVSPYTEMRNAIRDNIDNFIEVLCRCPIEILEKRDERGLYKKARKGELKNFTGVSDPYEEPKYPELIVNTAEETPEQSAARIITKLEEMDYLEPVTESYSPEEEEKINQRLKSLGYL